MTGDSWPALPYEAWRDTRDMLHMYMQVVGKLRFALSPFEPEWANACTHLDQILDTTPSGNGCVECLAAGRHDWVHLRVCQECGHVGCCDSSPGKHATAHNKTTGHPVIRSFEPGEDWYYCYIDDFMFELDAAPEAPSHTQQGRTS